MNRFAEADAAEPAIKSCFDRLALCTNNPPLKSWIGKVTLQNQ
jgi:hypothetical protein